MKFHIPFTFSSTEILKKRSSFFSKYFHHKRKSKLADNLKESASDLTRNEYLSIVMRSFFFYFILLYLVATTILTIFAVSYSYLFGLAGALVFTLFISFSQLVYPATFILKRQRDIEKNLMPALEDILVQLDSGIPLFSVLVNISDSGYGELSSEFKKAVRKIHSGYPEQEVLNELSKNNPSVLFKRTLWQISNGMNSGSDMTIVIKDSIKFLNEEQLIQIQNYGNKLNPLVVFYMIIAVIIPALSITFLTILSSMIGLTKEVTMTLFFLLAVIVVFAQIMFIGIIKSRRPSLL